MDLGTWIQSTGQTQKAIAERFDVSRQTLIRWINKTSRPGPEKMQEVYVATEGLVTANDFYGLDPNCATCGDVHEGDAPLMCETGDGA